MRTFQFLVVLMSLAGPAAGVEDSAPSRDVARGHVSDDRLSLENGRIRCVWQIDGARVRRLRRDESPYRPGASN